MFFVAQKQKCAKIKSKFNLRGDKKSTNADFAIIVPKEGKYKFLLIKKNCVQEVVLSLSVFGPPCIVITQK